MQRSSKSTQSAAPSHSIISYLRARFTARILARALPIVLCSAASLGLALGVALAQTQQDAPPGGILADGNTVVTGFSGAQPPLIIPPGVDPIDHTFIDLAGASVRVIDLQAPGAAPDAQLLQTPKPFTVTAGQVGQVFGVAIDNATPPNIYVAATSAYGLPIIVSSQDGKKPPERLKQGAPNASFMPGLFGPTDQQGGPGSIWRIDGSTGDVRLFANVALDGAANPGPALGGLAFDAASSTLFVADGSTGMIHAFDLNGTERGRYDHGMQGRRAAGLPQVPFDPAKRLDITNAQFQTADPATWGYAPPERRIFGLAVHNGRLYYAVADGLQIWSVAVASDGTLGEDARVEIKVPPGNGATEISKIAFDGEGRMLLAERAAPTGAFDLLALAQEASGRVLRYAPANGGASAAAWQSDPDTYAIGFADPMNNANGGIAVGYGYDSSGKIDRDACSGFLWSTGERLFQKGASILNGLQGNGIDLVRPQNVPPQQSYFVDYDDRFEDADARGQLGDIAILRNCARAGPSKPSTPAAEQPAPAAEPSEPTETPSIPSEQGEEPAGPGGEADEDEEDIDFPLPPPPICPPGMHLATNALQCCQAGQIPGFTGACQSPCANGALDAASTTACRFGFQPPGPGAGGPGTCWNGTAPLSLCAWNNYACKKCPKSPLKTCPAGFNEVVASAANPPQQTWWWSDRTCVPTAAQAACALGQQVGLNGACLNICPLGQTAFPVNRCCWNGTQPNALGQCNPGILIPPIWYLDYLATGSGPCVPPNCSYYEFTITGRQRFGRGSLTQRITLPPGSDFPEARVTQGSKYCPAARWSCSKTGNVVTCNAEDCGLSPGDKVVLRLEGKVAPDVTAPPPTTIEKTACGVLQWRAMLGPGPATIAQVPGGAAPPRRQRPGAGDDTQQPGGKTSKETCWTIRIVGKPPPPTCAPDYVETADGQCCLRSQMTTRGVCCPVGQRPDARRRRCVDVSPPPPPPAQIVDPEEICREKGWRWTGRRCIRPPRVDPVIICREKGWRWTGRRCIRPALRPKPPVVRPGPGTDRRPGSRRPSRKRRRQRRRRQR